MIRVFLADFLQGEAVDASKVPRVARQKSRAPTPRGYTNRDVGGAASRAPELSKLLGGLGGELLRER